MERRNATAAVIGAGDFIGSAIARKFAAEGFTVFAGRRNGEKLAPLVNDVEATGRPHRWLVRSTRGRRTTSPHSCRRPTREAPLEVCIFNVGANVNFPLVETTERVFRKVWEMACYAGFLAGREAARLMLPHGRGAIFFTGATASLRGGAGYAAFAAAKAGLRAVAQSAARELGPKNIHVAHLVIDAGVDTAWVRERIRAREGDESTAQLSTRPADAAGFGRRRLLAAVSAAARCLDVRDGHPSVRREMVIAMRNVEFHFDFGSPNAYLSHLVIPDIERRTGAKFVYVPVLLGGVFKLTNNRSPAESLAGIRNKPEYQRLETARFVQRHGITRFTPNPFFPVNTLVLMRGAIAAQRLGVFERYVDEIYRHMWAEPKKLDDPEVLRAALAESGLDADAILALAQAQDVKDELLANTQRSVERGTFGSPTFFVGDEIYFGKDRLRDVEEAIIALRGSE